MPLIQIPYIKQPKNSQKCGLACASMILKYYTGKKIDQELAFNEIKEISELNRFYCKTHKISQYLTNSGLSCTVVRYNNLIKFITFCNINNIAPIINHRSFGDNLGGHFSVVKNIFNDLLIINDPENKNLKSVPLIKMQKHIEKKGPQDEIGGNIAIIPNLDHSKLELIDCPQCSRRIDISFVKKANSIEQLIDNFICNNCDATLSIN